MEGKQKPMRLNFKRAENIEKGMVNSIIKSAAFYDDFSGIKTYGIDLRNLKNSNGQSLIDNNSLELALKAFRGEQTQGYGKAEIIELYKEIMQHPDFTESAKRVYASVDKHLTDSVNAWKQYEGTANDYVSSVLGLDNFEMDDVTINVGVGISSCTGPNSVNYGGSSSNPENDDELAFRARNFLHEWLHCIEAKHAHQGNQKPQSAKFGFTGESAPHAAVFLFERYFYHKKIDGNIQNQTPFGKKDEGIGKYFAGAMGEWAHDMKYDFANFLANKGESTADIIDFLSTQDISITPEEITKQTDTDNFLDFRNKWCDKEYEKTQLSKQAEHDQKTI